MNNNWEKIINTHGLFWQYPVITEKKFCDQNWHMDNFVGFPWATILDKRIDLNLIAKILLKHISKERKYFTCCQHIRFRELIPLFKYLGIDTVYASHKVVSEDTIDGVEIKPCPLYAVNFEDNDRNKQFTDKNLLDLDRDLLFCFVGGLQPGYLTDVRDRIFKINNKGDSLILNTGGWHFNDLVYTNKQNINKELNITNSHIEKTSFYNDTLLRSRYSLCPSGTGPNTIRFWESLAAGTIPVLLSDTVDLPRHDLWDSSIVRLKESEVSRIREILSSISREEEQKRRENCIKIYNFFKDCYTGVSTRPLVHYCCGSYYNGNFGGVACFDYQLSLIAPHRVFFNATGEKQKMIDFLQYCKSKKLHPLVITDNHLSCDIPNDFDTIIVHHGSALTHAERNPNWDFYWKQLCCSGQNKMLYYRSPKNTTIISISTFCTDEFTRFFSSDYLKFKNKLILHSSEMCEDRIKNSWNKKPVILGNWPSLSKGNGVINKIKLLANDAFIFKSLNVSIKTTISDFITSKQEEYIKSDIFLQLSVSEGNSYASLDAMMNGLVVVATNVGLFYKDVPEDCFVKLDWSRMDDAEYILNKLKYAWDNRNNLSKNARKWYYNNCRKELWKSKMLVEISK